MLALPGMTITERRDKKVFLFIVALIVYVSGVIVPYFVSVTYAQALQAISLIPMLVYGSQLVEFTFDSPYFRLAFMLFMFSNAFIMVRVEHLGYVHMKELLFSDFRLWPYLVPFVALMVSREYFFRNLFNWLYWLGVAFLVLSPLLWKIFNNTPGAGELSVVFFTSGSGFVLLTWKYHTFNRRVIAAAAVLLALLIATILARRNVMLTNIDFIIFAFLTYLFFVSDNATKKFMSIYGFAVIIIAGLYIFEEQKNTNFKLIATRANDDTREYVFNQFFSSMQNNMWWGRGMDGTYYCPLVTEDTNVDAVEYRDLIECGYLQVILKGGYINLFLFLAVMVPALFLGLFDSRNVFTKACGVIIVLWLIDMGPYGIPSMSVKYILVWICVGVCYNRKIRQAGESYIDDLINRKAGKIQIIN